MTAAEIEDDGFITVFPPLTPPGGAGDAAPAETVEIIRPGEAPDTGRLL